MDPVSPAVVSFNTLDLAAHKILPQIVMARYPQLEAPLAAVSWASDPGLGLTFVFPALFAARREVGARFLGSLVTSTWLCHLLKWGLREDRPYW